MTPIGKKWRRRQLTIPTIAAGAIPSGIPFRKSLRIHVMERAPREYLSPRIPVDCGFADLMGRLTEQIRASPLVDLPSPFHL
jgi:hypothetical protein